MNPDNGMPDITIAIVNYNAAEMLRDCLHSIERQSGGLAVETIVVDNASADESAKIVRHEFPGVQLFANEENTGYAAANNQAIAASSGRFIMLLNSDTVIEEGSIQGLAEFLEAHPAVGVAGARLVNADKSLQRHSRGWRPTLATAACQFLLLSSLFPRSQVFRGFHAEADFDVPEDVGWVSSACSLYRRQALEEAGGLSVALDVYATDVEHCMRVGDLGWRVCSVPCDVVHHGGVSFTGRVEQARLWFRSFHMLFDHYYGRARATVFDVLVAAGFTMRTVVDFIRGVLGNKGSAKRVAAHRAIVGASMKSVFRPQPSDGL